MEDAADRIVVRIKSSIAREAMLWLYEHEPDKEAFQEGYDQAIAQIERNDGFGMREHYNVAFPIEHRDMAMRFKLTWGGE